jgi:hypothetical protein
VVQPGLSPLDGRYELTELLATGGGNGGNGNGKGRGNGKG